MYNWNYQCINNRCTYICDVLIERKKNPNVKSEMNRSYRYSNYLITLYLLNMIPNYFHKKYICDISFIDVDAVNT